MKRVVFTLSLIGNFALAAVVATRYSHRTERLSLPAKAPVPVPNVSSDRHIPLGPQAWASLRAGSDQEFAARLKAEAFPRDLLLGLLSARLDDEFADRRAAIATKRKPVEYWNYYNWNRSSATMAGYSPEALALVRALENEKGKRLSSLLGEDEITPEEKLRRQASYGNLSPEVIRQVQAINRDYAELAERARGETQGIVLPADQEKFKFIEQERDADLKALMTPEQFADYSLRSSTTAVSLQNRLGSFQPSEDEYKKLYSLQKAFDDEYGGSNLTLAQEARQAEARPKLVEEIRAALGPDRFADYQVTTSPLYYSTSEFVSQWALPTETTRQLVTLQQAIAQQVTNIKADPSLTPEQRYANLSALSEQANAQVTQVLGAETLPRYQNSAGDWLRRIKPAQPNGKTR